MGGRREVRGKEEKGEWEGRIIKRCRDEGEGFPGRRRKCTK